MKKFSLCIFVFIIGLFIFAVGCSNSTSGKNNSLLKIKQSEIKEITLERIIENKTIKDKKSINKVCKYIGSINCKPVYVKSPLVGNPGAIVIKKKDKSGISLAIYSKKINYIEFDSKENVKVDLWFQVDESAFEEYKKLYESLK